MLKVVKRLFISQFCTGMMSEHKQRLCIYIKLIAITLNMLLFSRTHKKNIHICI